MLVNGFICIDGIVFVGYYMVVYNVLQCEEGLVVFNQYVCECGDILFVGIGLFYNIIVYDFDMVKLLFGKFEDEVVV